MAQNRVGMSSGSARMGLRGHDSFTDPWRATASSPMQKARPVHRSDACAPRLPKPWVAHLLRPRSVNRICGSPWTLAASAPDEWHRCGPKKSPQDASHLGCAGWQEPGWRFLRRRAPCGLLPYTMEAIRFCRAAGMSAQPICRHPAIGPSSFSQRARAATERRRN